MEQERHNVNTQWKLLVWLKCKLQQLTVLGWAGNSRHFAKPPLQVFPQNNVWKTSTKIPYLWHVITQIWVVTSHQYGISALVYWSTDYWTPVSSCPLRGLFFVIVVLYFFCLFVFLFALWGSVIHAVFLLKYFIYCLCLVSWPLQCNILCNIGFAWSLLGPNCPTSPYKWNSYSNTKGGAAAPFLPPLTTSKSTQAMEGWSSHKLMKWTQNRKFQICWCTSFKEACIHFSRSHPCMFDAPWLWL